MIKVEVFTNPAFVQYHKKLPQLIQKAKIQALRQVGSECIKKASYLVLKTTKTGVKYSGLRRRSASAGEAFANQTGRTRRGIKFSRDGSQSLEWGHTTLVGLYQEEGTSRMPAHPVVKPAQKTLQKRIHSIIGSTIHKSIKF